jgi:hypothetical protein
MEIHNRKLGWAFFALILVHISWCVAPTSCRFPVYSVNHQEYLSICIHSYLNFLLFLSRNKDGDCKKHGELKDMVIFIDLFIATGHIIDKLHFLCFP